MSGNDDFKPVNSFDVSDDNPRMLAHRLDHIARRMDSGFERMEMSDDRALTMLEQIKDLVAEHGQRITAVERRQDEHDRLHRDTQQELRVIKDRLAAHEARPTQARKKARR